MFYRCLHSFFFANYFYGCCAVALSIEAGCQQGIALLPFAYYLVIFSSTVLYYTFAYTHETPSTIANERSLWYQQHRRFVSNSNYLFSSLLLTAIIWCSSHFYWQALKRIHSVVLSATCLAGLLYYVGQHRGGFAFYLRGNGILKPMIIGAVWAGVTTLFPLLAYTLFHHQPLILSTSTVCYWIHNGLFITILCILFDIKDYATDANQRLKTVVVKWGLRTTIYRIVFPLSFLGLGVFWGLAYWLNLGLVNLLLNTIPFVALWMVAHALQRRKPIIYYLAIIDGIMLLKALCGILAFRL